MLVSSLAAFAIDRNSTDPGHLGHPFDADESRSLQPFCHVDMDPALRPSERAPVLCCGVDYMDDACRGGSKVYAQEQTLALDLAADRFPLMPRQCRA